MSAWKTPNYFYYYNQKKFDFIVTKNVTAAIHTFRFERLFWNFLLSVRSADCMVSGSVSNCLQVFLSNIEHACGDATLTRHSGKRCRLATRWYKKKRGVTKRYINMHT
jgi:hypothetical protein